MKILNNRLVQIGLVLALAFASYKVLSKKTISSPLGFAAASLVKLYQLEYAAGINYIPVTNASGVQEYQLLSTITTAGHSDTILYDASFNPIELGDTLTASVTDADTDSVLVQIDGGVVTAFPRGDTIKINTAGVEYQTLDANRVVLLGTAGITAARAAGKVTITVPSGGVLASLMNVEYASGDATYAAGSMTNALAVEIIHLDGTTKWSASPTVLQWNAGNVVNAGNSPDKMFGTADEDWEIHAFAAGTTTYVFNELSTRTSPDGGTIFF